MFKLIKFFLVFLLIANFNRLAWGQNSTMGREFWVGFMENVQFVKGSDDKAVLVITADEKASGAIEYLGRSAPFDLEKGEQFVLRVGSGDLDLMHRTSEEVENKGIYITASGRIAVHAFNEQTFSADGTVVLPVKTLGKEYYITSHDEERNGLATLLVVATEDNTEVEITTTVESFFRKPANVPFTITLNRGQSYQLKANGDITGTQIRVLGDNANNCKKIAVFGGNVCTTVGECLACDHLFQQAYPISTWGTDYVHVALKGRTSGEMVKVLASEDETLVKVNGEAKGTIGRGEFMRLDFQADESCKIETSKPSSVTVFSKGMLCNDVLDEELLFDGDPFMLTYSSSDQYLKELVFNSIKLPVIDNHYINIVVKDGTQGLTVLDGVNIGGEFAPLPGDPGFQIGRVKVAEGVHHLVNPEGFIAYAYGFGRTESYGYAAGAALDNLNLDFESNYEFEVVGEKVACFNQEGTWSASISDPGFEYFVWDFGDGSPTQTGKNVTHTFTASGQYVVSVTASKSPNSCEDQEQTAFEVEVLESKAKLDGETYVCPKVEEVMYRLLDKEHIAETEYEVIGGEIVENYGDSVLVKWGQANANAKLIMIPHSENGCPGVPVELEIEIGPELKAPSPIGPNEVCFDPKFFHTYYIEKPISGREYEWEVFGGTLVSGQGSGRIEVIWDQPGIEAELGYTVYSIGNRTCSGTSPKIKVEVTDELAKALVTDVTCFGEFSGQIELATVGGRGPYTYEWLHDPNLNVRVAKNLSAGIYAVTITDEKGCSQLIDGIKVSEPELFRVNSVDAIPVTCFGRDDGTVNISMNGGTKPYQIEYYGIQTFSEKITMENLAIGEYHMDVMDKNGCRSQISFEIISPPPLEVEVRLTKPACPGEENGELIAITEGIIGPKDFNWIEVGQNTELAIGLGKGEYHLELRDSDDCIYKGKGWVDEAAPEIRMPTGFAPGQLPNTFSGVSNCDVRFDLWVYDRWGELIYFGNTAWDGKMNGKEASPGTYAYIARYYYVLDEESHTIVKKGAFMLVR